MKKIQGRLKSKNKLRSPLGRAEQKRRLIQPRRCQCGFVVFCSAVTCRDAAWGPAPSGGPPPGPFCPRVQPQGPAAHPRLGRAIGCASVASSSVHPSPGTPL